MNRTAYDLSKYHLMGKLCLYSELREGDWLLKAFYPSTTKQRQEWTVYVYRFETLIRQVKLPMDRAPTFGPDGCDGAELEESLAAMMKELIATRY